MQAKSLGRYVTILEEASHLTMDTTFTSKKQRKSKSKKKSKSSKSSRVSPSDVPLETLPTAPVQPVAQADNLDSVLSHEMTSNRVVVNKGAATPLVLPEQQATQAVVTQTEAAPAPAQGETAQGEIAPAPAQGETNETTEAEETGEDVVTGEEVLETVQDGSRKRRGGAGSGDYGAAYNELYTQLCMRMLNRIHKYFQKVYRKCGGDERKFKKSLEGIQKWNQGEINKRAREILEIYPDTEAYFRYAYAANVMLMSVVVQQNEDSRDVEVEVPKYSDFILNCYVESARVLYDNAGVLSPSLPDKDKLRIREELLTCFSKAIATALRMMVPLDHIAPKSSVEATPLESFGDSDSEEDEESEESSEEDGSSDDDDSSGEEEDSSEEEDDSEEESGSENSDDSDSSEGEDDSGSEEESEESEVELPLPKGKKRIKASRHSLNTPDDLLIDRAY